MISASLSLTCHSLHSQYANDWIDFSQKYYRIPVAQDGIYRINYLTLQSAGISVSTIDPRQIQIFCLGEEQYIYVHGENDGIFHATDFIEFYGRKNTADADLPLFSNPANLTNPNYSYFNDTLVYFLTVTSGINNRRIVKETDQSFSSYSTVPYLWKTSRQDYTGVYFAGQTNSYGLTDFEYTAHEGWFDNPFSINTSNPGSPTTVVKSIPTAQTYTSGPPAQVDLKVVGASNYNTVPNHHLQISFPGNFIDTLYTGYTTIQILSQMSPSLLGNLSTNFTFTLPNTLYPSGQGADRNTISYIQVKYPHTTHMENLAKMHFHVPDQTGAKSTLQLSNINMLTGDSVIVYDLTNNRRISLVQDGGLFNGVVINTGQEKDMYLSTGSQINVVPSLIPVNQSYNSGFFTDYSGSFYSNTDYIIVSHASLMFGSQQYSTYRSTQGFNPLVVDVTTLYDQFSYGIRKHPLGIKNFIEFALDHFADTIHGLFLIGKGYKAGEGAYSYRKSQTYYSQTLVPSMGNPPSDIMFSNTIGNNSLEPAIPTGRLSVRSNPEVAAYLNKVIDYEAAQQAPDNPANPLEKEWMKKVLHFAGGSYISQSSQIENYLNQYRDTIQAPYFGANVVKTYVKNSTDPMQQVDSDSLKDIINNGVAMMTFFGHAAGIGFDISIDNPSEYNNYKKYFFVLALSCLSGDLFQPTNTSSEEFVNIENKGAIAYLGSTTNALMNTLHTYATNFMGELSYSSYGKSIGYLIKKTINETQSPGSELAREICYSMTLHGDPVLKLYSPSLPDYVITPPAITFNPPFVNTELDSFEVVVISKNLGRAIVDNFTVELVRNFPDNSSETYQKFVPATIYADTLIFVLPVDLARGVGLNSFTVTLDAFYAINESVETNNTATKQMLITSSDIIPLWPYEFAVIPDMNVRLVASTGNPFAPTNTYYFEIDTTDTFDSPFLQGGQVIAPGGIVEWDVPFPMSLLGDSAVYFWRTRTEGSDQWRESSFQFITNKRGWGQAHFFQFKKDNFQKISYNRPQRDLTFDSSPVWISAQTSFFDGVLNPSFQWFEEWIKMNGVLIGQWSCVDYNGNGMKFAVFNPVTIDPWLSMWDPSSPLPQVNETYENWHCRAYNWSDFDFFTQRNDTAEQSLWHLRMANFIDTIPAGYYVLAMSHRDHNAEQFPEVLYQAFESIGSGYIRSIENMKPYMIFGRKGDAPGSADESIGASTQTIIKNDYYLPTNYDFGSVTSTLIGPASEWGSLHWRIESSEAGVWTDTTRLYVLGQTNLGTFDTLIGPLPPVQDSLDILNLNQRIDAAQYPYLLLYLTTKDETNRTPSQIVRWHVLYEGVPETALSPGIHFSFYNDTVQEGEQINMSIATKNISIYDFPDSLMVDYWVLNNQNQIIPLVVNKLTKMHPSGDVIVDSVSFSTVGMSGWNSLWIEFNPVYVASQQYHQLEQFHFNNIAQIPFYVGKDRINPMLDVTFDGVRILDGDIVSARPNIQIMLKDENRFLLLEDTTSFRLFLQKPNSELERIYFVKNGRNQMFFYPASSSSNNLARVEFSAVFPEDGMYKLRVQASDISQNESGDVDYIINFRVINKSTITEIMNWPNPFSTRTHFVFTLTGSVIPDYFKIQIMTITGKVVREIDITELGPIHIGRNITQYAWDGRDQFGDQLANGVYLYRVITKINGQDIELNATEASQYFTKEFGKMVLIR